MIKWTKILLPYEQAVEELKIKFKSIRKEYRKIDEYSPIEFVTGRVKKISSIINKAAKRNISLENVEEEIEDIAGIRIMCQFTEDIYKVIELIRSRNNKDLHIVEERNYLDAIKESGYRSYHIIIKYPLHTVFGEKVVLAEIQIRTLAMNFWATIEHSLNYKFESQIPQDVKDRLKNAAEAAYKLDMEMSQIRDEVVDAQELFQAKSNVVEKIVKNIQKLKKLGYSDAEKLQKEFLYLKKEGVFKELISFNNKLEALLETMCKF
ncbi:GTP pyrophosphokinase family protein [Clostridiaceae bacterium M8S5]|nr:GTP pyrophosphokinase family protein [Clostridiaceae bacterium M8S5]